MQKWIIIENEYLDYLRSAENRIPNASYGADKIKPFFGVLFEKDGLAYVTQVSHPKERHKKMKSTPDFIKVFFKDNQSNNSADRLACVVNLNYMFPVPKTEYTELKYKKIEEYRTFENDDEKSKYIDLLKRELSEINKLKVDQKAKNLYKRKTEHPEDPISMRCLDFKELEKLAKGYKSNS